MRVASRVPQRHDTGDRVRSLCTDRVQVYGEQLILKLHHRFHVSNTAPLHQTFRNFPGLHERGEVGTESHEVS